MRRTRAFTLVELLVVVGIIGILAGMLVPYLVTATKDVEGKVCMSNLRNLGTGVQLYRQHNDQRWPWIPNVSSDFSQVATGTNRDKDPWENPENPGERSITAVMFLLVRDLQPPGLFVCPSDEGASEDTRTRWDHDANEDTPSAFYWDFASERNVSYSWQAPVKRGEKYVNGLSDVDPAAVVLGERTPGSFDPSWQPTAMTERMSGDGIRHNMSRNHRGGKVINVLRVDMSVTQRKRPDIGLDHDNIYTASGKKQVGSREATSLDLAQHLSPADTFLIGPVGESGGDDEQP